MELREFFRFALMLDEALTRCGYVVHWKFIESYMIDSQNHNEGIRITTKQGWGGSASTVHRDFSAHEIESLLSLGLTEAVEAAMGRVLGS